MLHRGDVHFEGDVVLRKENKTGEKKTGKLLEDGDGERGAGRVFLLNSQYEPSRKSLAPTKEFMLHLPGGFFHFDFEVCPPQPNNARDNKKLLSALWQTSKMSVSENVLRLYHAFWRSRQRQKHFKIWREKKWRLHQMGNSGLLFIYNIWIPVFGSVGGGLVFVLLYSPICQTNTISE